MMVKALERTIGTIEEEEMVAIDSDLDQAVVREIITIMKATIMMTTIITIMVLKMTRKRKMATITTMIEVVNSMVKSTVIIAIDTMTVEMIGTEIGPEEDTTEEGTRIEVKTVKDKE